LQVLNEIKLKEITQKMAWPTIFTFEVLLKLLKLKQNPYTKDVHISKCLYLENQAIELYDPSV